MSEGNKKFRLILASKSPRRQEMMKWLQVPFEIQASQIEEKIITTKDINEVARFIAQSKGQDILEKNIVKKKLLSPIVVSADTIVAFNNKIFGKPKSIKDAEKTLKELSGKVHEVVTAVYIGLFNYETKKRKESVFHCTTMVHFEEINERILDLYLSTNDSLDKAGSYGVQGMAQLFIKSINGSYSNVVGFPVSVFVKEMNKILQEELYCSDWRKLIG